MANSIMRRTVSRDVCLFFLFYRTEYSLCLQTYRAEGDSAAEEDDGEEGGYAGRARHPGHANEDDDAEDVLNAGQVNPSQGAQVRLCLRLRSGPAIFGSRGAGLNLHRLNGIVVIGQAREQRRDSFVFIFAKEKHLISVVEALFVFI